MVIGARQPDVLHEGGHKLGALILEGMGRSMKKLENMDTRFDLYQRYREVQYLQRELDCLFLLQLGGKDAGACPCGGYLEILFF
jgi:hypothetical protein